MKRLTCELCGSTDLLKDGGVFICQSCGCKYTMEEARKMMEEGASEVSGTPVAVDNTKINNLMSLAKNALESNNYARAEELFDEILTMDVRNFEAWVKKGQAILSQLSNSGTRILEAYNCLMTACRIPLEDLKDSEKNTRDMTLVGMLVVFLKTDLEYWITGFESNRPTDAALNAVKSAYEFCCEKLMAASKEEISDVIFNVEFYQKLLTQFFCNQCNQICVSAWKSTVAYNFFREDLATLGGHWNRTLGRRESGTYYFRPNDGTFTTFLQETDNMVALLKYCLPLVDKLDTSVETLTLKKNMYANIAYFNSVVKNQVSYKAMVETTTDGYGGIVSEYKYYEVDTYLTANAKTLRQQEVDTYEKLQKAAEQELANFEENEKRRKRQEYWEEHKEEKAALEAEKKDLLRKIADLKKEMERIPGKDALQAMSKEIAELEGRKRALGLFKGKEKKQLQEEINKVQAGRDALSNTRKAQMEILQEEINGHEERIEEIDEELNKDR